MALRALLIAALAVALGFLYARQHPAHYNSLVGQSLHYFSRPHSHIPDAPIGGPAAWLGSDFDNKTDVWRHDLSPELTHGLKASIKQVLAKDIPLKALTKDDVQFEPRFLSLINDWRQAVVERGFVVVRGIPVADWSTTELETFYWAFGLYFGKPGAQNKYGDLLGHVQDTGDEPGKAREYRLRVPISFHCDAADVVALLCVTPAKSGGVSKLASSVTIHDRIMKEHPHLLSTLYEPFSLDSKGSSGINYVNVYPARYFNGTVRTFYHSGYFRSAVHYPDARPLTPAQSALLDTIDAMTAEPGFSLPMDLRSGDMQLVSNHIAVHSRTGFEDYPEAERKRHLLRLWLSLPGGGNEGDSWELRWLRTRAYSEMVARFVWAKARRVIWS